MKGTNVSFTKTKVFLYNSFVFSGKWLHYTMIMKYSQFLESFSPPSSISATYHLHHPPPFLFLIFKYSCTSWSKVLWLLTAFELIMMQFNTSINLFFIFHAYQLISQDKYFLLLYVFTFKYIEVLYVSLKLK